MRPPPIPPTSTSTAAVRLNGTIRRIAATSETDVPLAYIPACRRTTTQVPDAEGETLALVRVRDRERDHEESAHPPEQQEPEPNEVRGDRVRQPRVAVVHPPDHREHHEHLDRGRAGPGDEHAGQLRDREDEDEIEEELERRDPRAPVDRLLGHGEIMAHTTGRSAAGQTAALLCPSAQRREKVTLTVAEVSCWPGTTGVEESAAALAASR